ncbi:MAG: amidohydrolase family protein [Rubrivivax sp.]|nr:amidohydrolase family protein [Rubrivivax sp.]
MKSTSNDPRRHGINRRHALCCTGALAAGLFTSLGARADRGPADGDDGGSPWRNPCRGTLPAELARHDVVLSAFDGLDATKLVDVHAHLLGTGDSGSGCTIHPSMRQWWRPLEVLRRKVILNAACIDEDAGSVDRAYVQRLSSLAADFPAGARWWLYAFAHAADDDGRERPDWSTFTVPDAYAAEVAAAHPARFDWVASIHPYRPDAVERLRQAAARGAQAVKWLPSAMNIDLASPRCRPFYDALVATGLPLVVHCGEEAAAPGARQEAYGNPLAVRAPLAAGVTVIVAHAASLGHAHDTDRPSAPKVPAFDLWARVMDENRGSPRLLADLSAVFQRNRRPTVWRRILEREDWHAQLLHGSDHPLPGVMPLTSLDKLVAAGLLAAADAPVLQRVRAHNPLLADFVLKRRLALGSVRLPPSVFEGVALARLRAASSAAGRDAAATTNPTTT